MTQDPSSVENLNQAFKRILGDIFPRWHEIRDDYGNVYRVFDKKEDGKWVGDIVNKRSRKRKEFRRSKKRLVWDILYRHYDKKNLQFRTKKSCKSKRND